VKLHPESAKMFVVDEAVEKAKAIALRLLSRRAYTKKEIRDKLFKRECAPDAIETTINDFARQELLNDRVFAKRFVEERLRLKPCGRVLLARDLKRRGVPGEIIDEVLMDSLEEVDTTSLAYEVLSSRARRYEGLEKDKALNRMFGFLGRRGFDGGTARDVAKGVWQEIEDRERDS